MGLKTGWAYSRETAFHLRCQCSVRVDPCLLCNVDILASRCQKLKQLFICFWLSNIAAARATRHATRHRTAKSAFESPPQTPSRAASRERGSTEVVAL